MYFVLALACCTFSHDAAARTDTRSEQTPSEDDDSEWLQTGIAAYKKRDYVQARESLLRAWNHGKLVTVVGMLAETEMKLGRYADAAEHWSDYLRVLPEENAEEREEAQKQLALCREQIGHATVILNQANAALLVDGKEATAMKDSSRREVWLSPGDHTLQARFEGRQSPVTAVRIAKGDELNLALSVPAAPSPAPTVRRTVAVSLPPAPVASHPGEKRSSTARTVALITESAMTLAALGVGIGTSISYKLAQSDASRLRDQVDSDNRDPAYGDGPCVMENPTRPVACDRLAARLDDRRKWGEIANVAFPVAGILGVITIGTYFLWPKTESEPSNPRANLTLTPYWSRSSQGVNARVTF